MTFKIYDCDFGFKYNGVNYSFTHVQSFSVEDPEMNRLTRGANAGNNTGMVFKEGTKDPKRITIPIVEMSAEIKAVLDSIYSNRERVDVYGIDRKTGSSKTGKDCILCQKPQQLTVDETPDSMNVSLIFETFVTDEVYKE